VVSFCILILSSCCKIYLIRIYLRTWSLRSIISVFLDQRTREKVILCSLKTDEHVPQEVFKIVSQQNIPACCGGSDHSQLINVIATLRDESGARGRSGSGVGGGGPVAVSNGNAGGSSPSKKSSYRQDRNSASA